MRMKQFQISIPQPFNFEATIKTHGWFQLPPFYWDEKEKTLNWALRVQDNLSLVQIKTVQNTEKYSIVRIAGHFNKDSVAAIKNRFRHILNLDLDLSEYYTLCDRDPILHEVPRRGIGRLMRAESLWEDLFKSICGTNVQWKQAVKMIRSISRLGDLVPGSEYRLFPGPEAILAAGESFLKDVGRVGYRSSYLLDLAERFCVGEPKASLVENGELSSIDMKKYFLGFKGIGKTTAHYLMALYGIFEEMAVDSLVVKYMKERHFDGKTPSEKEIVDFYSRFGRWSYLAYWMEFIINEGWNPDAG